MMKMRMEVRSLDGTVLPDWRLDDLDDTGLPAYRYAALARNHLLVIRAIGGPANAHSVRFLRGQDVVGSWPVG